MLAHHNGPMSAAPHHRCRVWAAPWPGVHVTQTDSGRHYGRHWHATFGLGLMEGGAQRSASGRGAVDAYAGDLLTTNPGEVHDGRPLGGDSRRWRIVYLEPQVLQALAGEGSPEVELTRPVLQDERLRCALLQLLDAVQGGAEPLACEEALVQACGLLLERHATARPQRPAAAVNLEAVRERLLLDPRPPTLDELAGLAGLGKFQLLRRFRQAHGLTPHAWLLQHRAERARVLVGRGVPLSAAAAAAGFADQSHMTRVFGRQFGYTPGAWQRALAQ